MNVRRTPVGAQRAVEVLEGHSLDCRATLVRVLGAWTLVLVVIILGNEDTGRNVDKSNVLPSNVLGLATSSSPTLELIPAISGP
jgi:hypothetical protein